LQSSGPTAASAPGSPTIRDDAPGESPVMQSSRYRGTMTA
jgi:hypothetical protein